MIAPLNSLQGSDFLDLADLDRAQLRATLDLAHSIKAGRWRERPLEGRHLADRAPSCQGHVGSLL